VEEIEQICFSYPWSLKLFEEELSNPTSICLKITSEEDVLAGYIILRDIVDEMHIMSIAVHPEFRGLGLAKKLMEVSEKDFCGGKLMLLEVRVSNVPAVELYKKLGFKQLYVRKKYYPDGEDAIVMEKRPCATVE
jgi:[ribosomal protein S18]-alanine N-acetyltransferase